MLENLTSYKICYVNMIGQPPEDFFRQLHIKDAFNRFQSAEQMDFASPPLDTNLGNRVFLLSREDK